MSRWHLIYGHSRLFSDSQIYLTSDIQSASLTWYQVSISDTRPIFQSLPRKLSTEICGILVWAPSLMRGRVCNLLVPLLLCLATTVTLGSKSRRKFYLILPSHLRLGSLFVDSQGYGGGILSRLHTGVFPDSFPINAGI
jgi:hypothetical protein